MQIKEPKRRRFHPLRKLGRIFRRRTITNGAEAPSNKAETLPAAVNSTSEKNLRSATLSSISSVVSASSPSSPLTHQQLQDAYCSQSLPKSKSYIDSIGTGTTAKSPRRDALLASLLGRNKTQQRQKQQKQQQLPEEEDVIDNEMYTTSKSIYHNQIRDSASASALLQPAQPATMRQTLGVAVLPGAMNRGFYAERQKLRSVGDSSQELDSSGNDNSATATTNTINHAVNGHSGGARSNGEMTGSQRSLSEGRLVDSDYCHDPLSQSHDSVFSESATASLFSNRDYQAELSDVLRKRNRNRPDASEEDLGLPRSPATPPRRAEHAQRGKSTASGHNASTSTPCNNVAGNQSEVSSLSLLSMNSGECDEILAASTANNSMVTSIDSIQERSTSSRIYTRSSTMCTSSPSTMEYSRMSTSMESDSKDETDLFNTSCQRLSHSAAKHKMALRPAKKKGPSRQHRRTLETSIPEANEDNLKLGSNIVSDMAGEDTKVKTRSLPPGVNIKELDKQHEKPKKPTAAVTTTPTKSKIIAAASAPNAGDQPITIKRTKLENTEIFNDDTIISKSTISNASASALFNFRAFSAKTTAFFDSPRESSTDPLPEELEQPKAVPQLATVESSESGFLRRFIQRNSKRSITHNSSNSETDMCQSEPKKLQVSLSCFDMKKSNTISDLVTVDKSKSALSYDRKIEETRKEIKHEIMSVGTNGLNALLNNTHTLSSASSSSSLEKSAVSVKEPMHSHKPKSGPAARQRYVPQNIDTLERKNNKTTANVSPVAALEEKGRNSLILDKTPDEETFQSTSIIRDITASQGITPQIQLPAFRLDHHFEKKPKIVGLSAFQQKISRSSDSFGRTASHSNSASTSTNSLETAGGDPMTFLNYEQKQRKAVEKSRSFRTYQEETAATSTVHNNMPSLPDLTLNLRIPCYNEFIIHEKEYSSPSPPDPAHDRSISLGFEINDNNLVKHTPRAESTGHLPPHHNSYNLSNNVIVKTTPTKLLTPASMVPALSPSTSCNQNLTEIEQNIDLLVKSPFISVLRKPTSTTMEERPTTVTICNVNNSNRRSMETTVGLRTSVNNANTSTSIEVQITSPTSAPLRDKSKLHSNNTAGRNSVELVAAPREFERKSAPAQIANTNKANIVKSTKRSTSLRDSPEEEKEMSSAIGDNVPEFMKIQLNRVDPARIAKNANVVLAKNVRETQTPQQSQVQHPKQQSPTTLISATKETKAQRTRTSSIDEHYLRRLSNESVEIVEKEAAIPKLEREPEKQTHSGVFEINGKNTKSTGISFLRHNSELPPKSPVKKSPTKMQQLNSPTENEEHVQLRTKFTEAQPEAVSIAGNKSSLQERKRIFLTDEKIRTDKKIEELRSERKRSITEEVYRKSFAKSEEKLDTSEKPMESVVMLRKKSFSAATQPSNEHAATNNNNSSNIVSNGNSATSGGKDDSTPELMKVFARRSLKVKDEDLNALSEKILANGNSGNAKKFMPSQQNVDSDKENQSASDEKLDKLPKIDTALEQHHTQQHATSKHLNGMGNLNGNSNRNSLADFRNISAMTSKSGSTRLSLNNGNNNNTVNTTNTTTATGHTSGNINGMNNRSFLPPIKMSGTGSGANNGSAFRNLPVERNSNVTKIYGSLNASIINNNNNNTNNTNNNMKHNNLNNNQQQDKVQAAATLERQSLNIKTLEGHISSSASINSAESSCSNTSYGTAESSSIKTIERSATVNEFKGIHQRRAEWEQRAKEALK